MQSVSADKREGGIGHRDLVRHHDDLGFGLSKPLSKPRNCDDRGLADRIQARAVRRCGELLRQIERTDPFRSVGPIDPDQ
jgi:hypothetical protein